MTVTERMLGLLGKSDKTEAQQDAVDAVAEEAAESVAMEPTSDLAYKAAQVLAVGLKGDLPDDVEAAEDLLIGILTQLRSGKKVMLSKALRRMGSASRAQALIRNVKKDI